ncbi:MAG TPA: TonB-dependent receptor [Puia sp.]|jgi:TonB-linked SusC/RagA family outer membrane protein|nr:TonB-dependent receptor [Puia sp.]
MEKKRIIALIPLAMRITIPQVFIFLFVLSCNAKELRGQEILNEAISLKVEKVRLKSVLFRIQALTDAKFVYSSVIIDANRKVTCIAENLKVSEVLLQLFAPLHINFRVIDDQVILYPGSHSVIENAGIPLHGKITDASGNPLVSATVSVKGTSISTLTDAKGVYVLNEVDPKSTIVISYVGYIIKEMAVNGRSELNTFLEENQSSLNQVIVIGYGTAKKKDVVGSVDIVSVKDAGNTAATNPSELLIGKSAGVQVVQTNGTPGSDAQILIRGTGSFTSVDPLYVIDGIQGDKNLFNSLSTQDIENITILKDASSTAIYGSAAANGVVLITTKKVRSGAPKISFTSQWGESKAWKQLHLLNASQYLDLLKDFAATNNTTLPAKFSTPSVLVDSNDWQKQIFRQGVVSENDINLSGGSDKVLYNLSVGYITQQSIIKSLSHKRLNVRLGLDETLGRFHLGQSIAIRYTHTAGQMANITDALAYAPYKPLLDPNILGGYSIESNIEDFSNAPNPLQAVNLNHPVTEEFVFFPQVFGEVSLIKGLRFRSQFQMEIGGGKYESYQYPYTQSNYLSSPRQAILNYNSYSYYTLENYFSYNKILGKHNISATIGNSYIDPGTSSFIQGTGTSIPNDNIQNISVAQSLAVTGVSYGYAHSAVISYFGRLVYSFDNKYILSGSMRRDGASNFGPNNQFGNFYGAGFAWRFVDEGFVKNNLRFISDGKLRVGWGRTGNNNIPTTGITSVLTYSGSPSGNLVYSLGTNEAFVPGTTIYTLDNPNIRWEQTDQTDAGLDIAFLNNKLNLTIDWYDRKSSGLLVSVPVSGSAGASLSAGQPVKTVNAADAENKGIEFSVGYHDILSKDLSFNVSANLAYNKNNVLSLGSQFTAPIQGGSFDQLSTFTYTAAGSPIGSFYGYKLDHVAKDQAEIDALNQIAIKKTGIPTAVYQSGLQPGDFIFKDLNGSGQVTDSDRAVLGNPIPKFVYGFSVGANFKNFDLNLVFSGVAGLQLVNTLKFNTLIEATGHNATTDILNRWRQPGDVAALPRAGQDANASGNLRASNWWLESGAYLRLRNITLGYTLPQSIITNIGNHVFARIRIYVAAQNLLTFTKYTGYDPEISTQNGGYYTFSRGIDDGQIPQPRTFLAGLQLGF